MSQLVKAAFKLACSAGVFIGRARMVLIAPIFLCHRIKDGGFIVAIRLTSFRPPKIRLHCRLLSNGKLPVYCTDNQILSYPHITSFDFEFFFKPEAKKHTHSSNQWRILSNYSDKMSTVLLYCSVNAQIMAADSQSD